MKKIKNSNKTEKSSIPTSLTAFLTPMVFKIREGNNPKVKKNTNLILLFPHRKIPNHQSSKECIKGAKSVESMRLFKISLKLKSLSF